jgi:hypothetical protein
MSKARSDYEFLERMHKVWTALLPLGLLPVAPLVQQVMSGTARVSSIMLLVVLLPCFVVPFLVETWGVASASVSRRFLSWTVLVIAIVTTLIFCAFEAIWFPLFVSTSPTLGGFASFGWEMGIVDGLILISSTIYINKKLMQYFRRNLKTKANLNQIPHNLKDLWQQTRLIYAAYWIFADVALYFLFLS